MEPGIIAVFAGSTPSLLGRETANRGRETPLRIAKSNSTTACFEDGNVSYDSGSANVLTNGVDRMLQVATVGFHTGARYATGIGMVAMFRHRQIASTLAGADNRRRRITRTSARSGR